MKNINVINNTGNNVNVTVNEKDNGIQILIDTVYNNKKRLPELKQYDHFFDDDGEEYILCEHFEDGTVSVLRADLLDKKMVFGNNNNWRESSWREYLTSMDGFDDYGYTMDKVAIRTFDEYRGTSKGVGLVNEGEFLATPNQTPSRKNTTYVQVVGVGGYVVYDDCSCDSYGVRPFFFLKSSVFVSLDA